MIKKTELLNILVSNPNPETALNKIWELIGVWKRNNDLYKEEALHSIGNIEKLVLGMNAHDFEVYKNQIFEVASQAKDKICQINGGGDE